VLVVDVVVTELDCPTEPAGTTPGESNEIVIVVWFVLELAGVAAPAATWVCQADVAPALWCKCRKRLDIRSAGAALSPLANGAAARPDALSNFRDSRDSMIDRIGIRV
jgi:hypothetical protein